MNETVLRIRLIDTWGEEQQLTINTATNIFLPFSQIAH